MVIVRTFSILNFSTSKYKISIWRSKPHEQTGFTDIQLLAMELEYEMSLLELAEELCKQDSVVKVEVLNWDNNGVSCTNE